MITALVVSFQGKDKDAFQMCLLPVQLLEQNNLHQSVFLPEATERRHCITQSASAKRQSRSVSLPHLALSLSACQGISQTSAAIPMTKSNDSRFFFFFTHWQVTVVKHLASLYSTVNSTNGIVTYATSILKIKKCNYRFKKKR